MGDLLLLILAFVLLRLALFYHKVRRIIPNRNEWLSVLDKDEWRTFEEIERLMQKEKNVAHDFGIILNFDFYKLAKENLIEVRLVQKRGPHEVIESDVQFRLGGMRGGRRRDEKKWSILPKFNWGLPQPA